MLSGIDVGGTDMGEPELHGLSARVAAERLRLHGPNLLPALEGRGWGRLALDTLREPMLLLLIAATAVYIVLGDRFEAGALGLSVLVVAALSLMQQRRAEGALRALRDLSSPRARVLRDGTWQWLPARDLVVGDAIDLSEGDRVPADARLESGPGLMVDESLLTGESMPVTRTAGRPGEERVSASTLVVSGQAQARVVATGAGSEVGRIGYAMRPARPRPTRTQREMSRAVAVFSIVGLGSCVLLAALHLRIHGDPVQALLAGITLAISNIPEEFPLVLTIFLALGALRLARAKALVRRAPALEALGAITVLCTDKTGTLTSNRMQVAMLAADVRSGPRAEWSEATARLFAEAALACKPVPVDPMDRAILRLAAERGGATVSADQLVHTYPLSAKLPIFGQAWQRPDGNLHVACKGAPESVVELCGLDEHARLRVLAEAEQLAREGIRVLGVASVEWPGAAAALPLTLRGLSPVWRGLIGFADPLREGVPAAVAEARAAGVRVVMLTGDHVETARAIACGAGLANIEHVETGAAIDAAGDAALTAMLREVDVFARVRPEHKLRLVAALRADGHVVAMTGDGVNDAPALMAANVGIAMGRRGTDVAREAAGIVLVDDDFATIVGAIRLGRGIYDNLRRAVRFIIAVHVPITGLAVLPLLWGSPMVLLPLHVVFLELIVDPACAIVLEREPVPADVMQRPPRKPQEHLLDRALLFGGLMQGSVALCMVMVVFVHAIWAGLAPAEVAALAFTAIVTGNLALIVANRADDPLRDGWRLDGAFLKLALAALAMLLLVTRVDAVALRFGFAPAAPGLALAAAIAPIIAVLAWSRWRRARAPD